MPVQPPDSAPALIAQRPLNTALAISLMLHALVLFFPEVTPPETSSKSGQDSRAANRIEARLAPRVLTPRSPPVPAISLPPRSSKDAKRPNVLTSKNPAADSRRAPQWSVKERDEMEKFLRELEPPTPSPTLAQRSLAMARDAGRHQARQDEGDRELVERVPNSPTVDPFSLQLYLDSLVSKLNRSAAFVRNDPRSRGVRTAAVLIRINPNGSLKSFQILNAADQQDEIAFIKSVVERAVPFSTFPPKLVDSAKSLGMVICITPANSGDGGFGFSRIPDGKRC